jgi:hypothetical protein
MSAAAVVVRKEIPAKIKTYLALGLWIMEKMMSEEKAKHKMIELFIGGNIVDDVIIGETVDAICGKFEAFNEKEMVEKIVQIHKSMKPTKKKTEKKTAVESPNNIVNELVSLATNANAVPENAVPENAVPENAVPENAVVENVVVENVVVTEDKKKRAAKPKAKPAPVIENVVPSAPELQTSDVKKKRVSKPKASSESAVVESENAVPSATENAVPSVVATENAVVENAVPSVVENENAVPSATENAVVENAVPSAVAAVKAPKKKATPKAKSENAVPSVVATENAVPSVVASAVTSEVVPSVVKAPKKKATPKAKSENAVPSVVVPSVVVPSVVAPTSEVIASEVKPSEVVVPSATEDKKKKPKASSVAKPTVSPVVVVESPKNDVVVPEEFEDTELVVKEFVYGTKSYYIDEEETIYEQEGLKKIGKLVNGKLVFDSV